MTQTHTFSEISSHSLVSMKIQIAFNTGYKIFSKMKLRGKSMTVIVLAKKNAVWCMS